MATDIKRLIVPATKTDEGLFPLTRCIPKELLPLGHTPVIQKVVDEAVECNVEEVVFILSSEKKKIVDQFTSLGKIPPGEESFREKYSEISFSCLTQKKSSGSGYTLFRAKEKSAEDAFAISFPENVFYGKKSSLLQLFTVYRTSRKQVAGLKEVSDEEVEKSYIVETEKIANRFYKIKKIVKNPQASETSSRLALAGRYIFTPAIFDYLKNSGTKTLLTDALNEMIAAGKTVYGHQCEGRWFPLENKESYMEAHNFFLNN